MKHALPSCAAVRLEEVEPVGFEGGLGGDGNAPGKVKHVLPSSAGSDHTSSACDFGTTKTWPLATGFAFMNASARGESVTLWWGGSSTPATTWQKTHGSN
jgi:hypothetical protein